MKSTSHQNLLNNAIIIIWKQASRVKMFPVIADIGVVTTVRPSVKVYRAGQTELT